MTGAPAGLLEVTQVTQDFRNELNCGLANPCSWAVNHLQWCLTEGQLCLSPVTYVKCLRRPWNTHLGEASSSTDERGKLSTC